ncbi:MAG: GDP-mannose 4,6-dehydratase [Candidatus Andersenbacteria bacterium]
MHNSILITGGAGFIGSHVAKALLERGDTVVIIDDFNDRYDPRLKEARIENMFTNAKPVVTRGDILDHALLEQTIREQKITKIIHLAAWASVQQSMDNPFVYAQANVEGTISVLEAARKHNIEHVVVASSSSVYGGITELPFREDMDVTSPMSPYAATKAATELMCATWNNMYETPITALRFFTVYGPWGRPEMALFTFARAIRTGTLLPMRGSSTKRDFTYIDDTVQGIIASLDNPNGYQVFNLGENDAVPLPRLIKALESALGRAAIIEEVPLPKGDIPATWADISRAREVIGYSPTTPIEEGVKEFVDWYVSWYVPNFEN